MTAMKATSVGGFQLALIVAILSFPAFAVDPRIGARDAYNAGDYATAAEFLKTLAMQGDVQAQFNLGSLYMEGKGVTQDHAAAATWFGKAARQGNALAQYNLGVLYREGLGIDADPARAWLWFEIAASGLTGLEAARAAKNRSDVEKTLTPEALQEARDMLDSCRQVRIQYCD